MTTAELRGMGESELAALIAANSESTDHDIAESAERIREEHFGRSVFFRGLIEFTNYCARGCYYCGISRDAKGLCRYRLGDDEILGCCKNGYALGFHTFVLQGGEDPYFTTERMCRIVAAIRERYPDCAISLSIGERCREDYRALFDAGANRYLLRHETATNTHYRLLHPTEMNFENRKRCLYDLREIGYQVGAGFMVGSPHQMPEDLARDLLFLKELRPHMVGIGPFVPSGATRFAAEPGGSVPLTLLMVALTRILLPQALLPSTTALGSIDEHGREKAISLGANVVMPNLSPSAHRADYALYNGKISAGDETAEGVQKLSARIRAAGFEPDFGRGDHPAWRGT